LKIEFLDYSIYKITHEAIGTAIHNCGDLNGDHIVDWPFNPQWFLREFTAKKIGLNLMLVNHLHIGEHRQMIAEPI
jgi:hypothetical protein